MDTCPPFFSWSLQFFTAISAICCHLTPHSASLNHWAYISTVSSNQAVQCSKDGREDSGGSGLQSHLSLFTHLPHKPLFLHWCEESFPAIQPGIWGLTGLVACTKQHRGMGRVHSVFWPIVGFCSLFYLFFWEISFFLAYLFPSANNHWQLKWSSWLYLCLIAVVFQLQAMWHHKLLFAQLLLGVVVTVCLNSLYIWSPLSHDGDRRDSTDSR